MSWKYPKLLDFDGPDLCANTLRVLSNLHDGPCPAEDVLTSSPGYLYVSRAPLTPHALDDKVTRYQLSLLTVRLHSSCSVNVIRKPRNPGHQYS
jgi:hypothetical protein